MKIVIVVEKIVDNQYKATMEGRNAYGVGRTMAEAIGMLMIEASCYPDLNLVINAPKET